jgi:hypothetical protein
MPVLLAALFMIGYTVGGMSDHHLTKKDKQAFHKYEKEKQNAHEDSYGWY